MAGSPDHWRGSAFLGARVAVDLVKTVMGGYWRATEAARGSMGAAAPAVVVAGAWYEEPAFIGAIAGRVTSALAAAGDRRPTIQVLMTAHSLPRRVAEQEPDYLDQLRATATAVAAASGLRDDHWTFCWQSAGHEPGEWMKPDSADLMPRIAATGRKSVLVVPIQFLADHLETLYDIDVGAREQAERHGVGFDRIATLNADARLIAALAAVARQTLEGRRPSGARSRVDIA